MKIAYDAKRLFNNTTGLGNYSRTLVKNLHQFHPDNEYLLFTPKIKKRKKHPYFHEHFKIIENQWTPPALWRSFWMSKYVERSECDIFHGLSNEIPLGLKNIKTIVTLHDLIFKALPGTYPKVDRLIYDKKSRYACTHSDVVVAISEHTKRDIITHYGIPGKKVKVIYQSCHPIYYQGATVGWEVVAEKFNLPSDFILSVGALQERKNTLGILSALRMMPAPERPALVVVGKGKKYKKKMVDFLGKHKLSKNVFFLDKYAGLEELKAIYGQARLLVYPSFYEGFGLPIVESLLSGTPVVTSNVSSLPEAAGPGGLLINPGEPHEIAEAISTLLGDSQLRNRLAKKGMEHALGTFHPQVVSQEIVDLYRKIQTS